MSRTHLQCVRSGEHNVHRSRIESDPTRKVSFSGGAAVGSSSARAYQVAERSTGRHEACSLKVCGYTATLTSIIHVMGSRRLLRNAMSSARCHKRYRKWGMNEWFRTRPVVKSAGRARCFIRALLLGLASTVTLTACSIGKITGVAVTSRTFCDSSRPGVCGAMRLDNMTFTVDVTGEGTCGEASLNFGDGSFPLVEKNVDFESGPWRVTHNYGGAWPGPKTIRAQGVSNCVGNVTARHVVFEHDLGSDRFDEILRFAVALDGTGGPFQWCYAAPRSPPWPALRPNTIVTVTSPPTPTINFGCPFNGCVYTADGKPGSSAGGAFPFPGFREFSLVLAVGSQNAQGGSSASFTTTQSGELLLCFNDGNMLDNRGGLQINISIDESAAN